VTANMSAATGARISAANTQVNAQAIAADYYSTQGGSLLSMLTQQKYNVLTALFGKA
jgi:3-phosphoglycerate kinase